jgi:hypothetical protein
MAVSIDQARGAQRRLGSLLRGLPYVNGIALRRKTGNDWELVVGVENERAVKELPESVDGVSVRAERVYDSPIPY